LAFGLPLLPHAFGLLAIESLNRYFLDSYGNKYELGLYSFAFTLAAPLGILNTAFITAWSPHLYRLFQEDTVISKNKILKVHALYILFILIIGILISILSKNILQIFSIKYFPAYRYLMVIPFYFCIQAIYVIFSATLFYFKKNKYFIYLSVVNIVFSFLINYILFSKYGISVTAYCAIFSLALFTGIIVILSQKTYSLPWLELFRMQNKKI
jgi:O-antigen/teichoic acid export membrane protein